MHTPPFVPGAMDKKYGVLVLLDPAKVMLMNQGPLVLFEVSRTRFASTSFGRSARNNSRVWRMRTFGARG